VAKPMDISSEEIKELEFYLRKNQKKKGKGAA
jgi:hypothetical protein